MLDWFKGLSEDNIVVIGLAVVGGLLTSASKLSSLYDPPKARSKKVLRIKASNKLQLFMVMVIQSPKPSLLVLHKSSTLRS